MRLQPSFLLWAGGKPLGILTLACGAHLNASDAFAGLSVFDGERVSTDSDGKIVVRIGATVVTLVERSTATLQRNGDGAHVDLDAHSVYLWSAESNPLEAHAEGALLRPHGAHTAQAQIRMFAPKILQIKVAYFIVAGAGAGSAAWGIHDLIQSNNGVESPEKP